MMFGRRKPYILFICIVSLCCIGTGSVNAAPAQELEILAQVNKTQVAVGQVLVYSIRLAGVLKQTPQVKITQFEGFDVVSTGQSQQIQIKEGQAVQALTLTYTLTPKDVGKQIIEAVEIVYEGQAYATQPIEVEVVPGEFLDKQERLPEELRLEGDIVL